MAAYQNLTDNAPDGALLGLDAASKWASHGATPVIQQTAPTTVTLVGPNIGGLTAADASSLRDAVNAVRTALVNKGIVA
jgi:hypothetical protein